MSRALWLATAVALAAHLAGAPHALLAAALLAVVPAVRFVPALRLTGPPPLGLEVRVVYAAALAVGTMPPLSFLHAMLLAGTAPRVVFDYCPLARMLSLLPWHRRGPLTRARLRATFLTPPVRGDLLEALER